MKTGRKKSTLKNIIFSAIAALLFFSLAEAALRIARFQHMPDDTPLVVMRDFQRDTYKTLYRFDPDTLWSLIPGALYEHEGTQEKHISSLGFRSPEILENKQPGSLRVVCLGDSSAFGLGVQQRFIYTDKLAAYLSQALPNNKVEVINAGVVGFTSRQALAHFKRDALPLQPDIVIISVGAINEVYRMKYSDPERIALVSRRGPMKTLRTALLKFRLGQLALWLARKIESKKSPAPGLSPSRESAAGKSQTAPSSTHSTASSKQPSSATSAIPAAAPSKPSATSNNLAATAPGPSGSKPRVSLAQFKNDLESFAALAQKNRFLLIVASPHRKLKIDNQYPQLAAYTAELEAFAKRRKLPIVDVHSYFRRANNEQALFRDDFHPSPLGHDLIAKMLAYTILKEIKAGRVTGFTLPGK